MKYKHGDIVDVVNATNEFLFENDDRLFIDFNYETISILSINKKNDVKTVLVKNVTRDESYGWLQGFNTAMKIINNIEIEDIPLFHL